MWDCTAFILKFGLCRQHRPSTNCSLRRVITFILLTVILLKDICPENAVCFLHLLHISRCTLIFLSQKQTLWTLIRLLLREHSDLGPHCLQYRPPKYISRRESRWQLSWLVWKGLIYSKTCLKWPLKKIKIGFQDRLSLHAGQMYCRILQGEHSAILATFIKLPFAFKTFVLSIFEWSLKAGFTVF